MLSGDSAYAGLPAHRDQRLVPALRGLLDAAVAAGDVRSGVDAEDLLNGIGRLYMHVNDEAGIRSARRMVSLLVDGLRYTPKA